MPQLDNEVRSCRACSLSLHPEVNAPVSGEGPLDCTLMVIGRNPGALENQSGRPFIGPAGQRLDEMLRQVHVPREQCYITNALKCFTIGNAPPPTPMLYQCAELHLAKELAEVRPKVILVMGREAQGAMKHLADLQRRADLLKIYQELPKKLPKLPAPECWTIGDEDEDSTHSVPIYYMVHPSAALRSPEFNARLLKQSRSLLYKLRKRGLV